MAITINKIRLKNYKRFQDFTINTNPKINMLAGDNESGKSSILEAIDLVVNASIRKVERIGVDRLLNKDAIKNFNDGERSFERLPEMIVELYLDGYSKSDYGVNGKNNLDTVTCDGIRLICEPNIDYRTEIIESMREREDYFPYDYYSIHFTTFSGDGYTGYKKKLKSILIDSTNMSSDYANNDFIRRIYNQLTEGNIKERAVHKSKYRQLKECFRDDSLRELNNRVPADKDYVFGLKTASAIGLEDDLMIYENEIGIDSKGMGRQVFVKTDFALGRSGTNVDVILIEEPENHLSHVNLRKLIARVSETSNGQLFITTHNSLISTRLELRNLLILHENINDSPVSLRDLSEDTAEYFMKAPVANIVEYVISNKAILVEGPSEYMLLEKFYSSVSRHESQEDNVHIIDVHGLSFKRYLDVAKLINNKVAVITDNDGDTQKHCVSKYSDYVGDANIDIFYDDDELKPTFELALYGDNVDLCGKLFGDNAQAYMLGNKTETAYKLLSQEDEIVVPEYIRRAIEWIKG
jgi:AAA15 family ATPase/GTPase